MINVLFSPIGTTDPARGDFDGPMLHIVRHYRPSKVVLYLTAKMAEYERQYQWYSWFIRKLSPETELRMIWSGIEDASDFSLFLSQFETEIQQLSEEMPDGVVLLNMSSGTPQMTSALCVIASTTACRVRAIQVKTPEKGANVNLAHLTPGVDKETVWDNLLDGDPSLGSENRCQELMLQNYISKHIHEILRGLIKKGAYSAAQTICMENKGFFSTEARHAVCGAAMRKYYQITEAISEFDAANIEVFPLVAQPYMNLLEFYLGMRHDYLREDYIRFFLRLTPWAIRLVEFLLKRECRFDTDQIKTNGKLDPMLLQQKYPAVNAYLLQIPKYNPLRAENISLDMLMHILRYYSNRKPDLGGISQRIDQIRKHERELRNAVAHTMMALNRQRIRSETGMTAKQYLPWLDQLFLDVVDGTPIRKHMLDSYQDMEEKLLELL